MAMSAALFGLVPGNAVAVDEPQVVRKSFPDFWKVWSALA
jgi:5-enolpyruvylshikimate-3-phosphate synthase